MRVAGITCKRKMLDQNGRQRVERFEPKIPKDIRPDDCQLLGVDVCRSWNSRGRGCGFAVWNIASNKIANQPSVAIAE